MVCCKYYILCVLKILCLNVRYFFYNLESKFINLASFRLRRTVASYRTSAMRLLPFLAIESMHRWLEITADRCIGRNKPQRLEFAFKEHLLRTRQKINGICVVESVG